MSRRHLLRAAAAAGGTLIACDTAATDLTRANAGVSDPELRSALRKYGGEFGQIGKGGSHGDI